WCAVASGWCDVADQHAGSNQVMSNWLSEYSTDDQKQVDQLNTPGVAFKPLEQKEESGALFKVAAPFRGAAAGFAKVGDAIAAPVDAVVDRVSYSLDDVGKEEFSEPYSAYK